MKILKTISIAPQGVQGPSLAINGILWPLAGAAYTKWVVSIVFNEFYIESMA